MLLQCTVIANCNTYSGVDCSCTACIQYFGTSANNTQPRNTTTEVCKVGGEVGRSPTAISFDIHSVASLQS